MTWYSYTLAEQGPVTEDKVLLNFGFQFELPNQELATSTGRDTHCMHVKYDHWSLTN